MDGFVIAGDVDGIMKERPRERWHLGNIINHLKQQRYEFKLKGLTANSHVPTVLNRAEYASQTVEPDAAPATDAPARWEC